MAHEPIKAGDLAEVIDGMLGKESPNIGLIVQVASLAGEHSLFGRIWRCRAEYGIRGQEGHNVPSVFLDFAQSWLRKIKPPPTPLETKTKETEFS